MIIGLFPKTFLRLIIYPRSLSSFMLVSTFPVILLDYNKC